MISEKNIYSYATYSSMNELLEHLHQKEEVEDLCKEKGLNPAILRPLFEFSMRGHNNADIAQKMGVHRITIQRYATALKNLKESDFQKLRKYIFGGSENEARNNDKDR